MTDDPIFTAEDFAEGGDAYKTLGPSYFAARRYVAEAVKKATDDFYDQLREKVETYLWSDAEANLQGQMWRMVDASVQALLTGEVWAIERYALGERYDTKAVREAVIKHAPPELWDKRVTDLQAEIDRLKRDLQFERDRNRDRY